MRQYNKSSCLTFRCHICGKPFRVKSTRDAHLKTHEKKKTIACEVCQSLFSSPSSLKVHMRLHTGSRPYNCAYCNRTFRTSGHLQSHVKSHTKSHKNIRLASGSHVQQRQSPMELFGGQIVDASQNASQISYNTNDLLVSSAVQDENSVIGDPSNSTSLHASTAADYLQLLQLPTDNLQNIQISNLDINAGDDILQNFIFITEPPQNEGQEQVPGNQSASVVDIVENHDVSLYVPDLAKYNTSTGMGYMDQNIYVLDGNNVQIGNGRVQQTMYPPGMKTFHTAMNGSDPFLTVASEPNNPTGAAVKNKKVSLPRDSSTSQDSEVNGNSKLCPDCGRMFLKPSQMLRHRRIHTGEKPHVCKICQSTFSQKSSLDTHIKFTHSDVRPYTCSQCAFQTVQKAALKKHFTKAHPHLRWDEQVDRFCANVNSPGISVVTGTSGLGRTGAHVTTTQINITTGIRDRV